MLSALPLPHVRAPRTVSPTVAAQAVGGPDPLLLVGHGTRCVVGERQFRSFVQRVGALLAPDGVDVAGGLIELAPPPVTDAVADLVSHGHRQVVAVPLMLVAAGHAKGDIPAALDREVARYPGLGYRYGAVLGPDPMLLAALGARLDEVLARSERADTHVLLVGRGSTDPDANSEVARAARLFFETTVAQRSPVAGVETAFVSLAAPGVAAALERCRALGAGRVVVLPLFMFAGVLPQRIVVQARTWGAAHPHVQVRTAEVIGDCDELAAVVAQRYTEALRGAVRAHCDTCVYRVAIPGFEHRVGQPQTPHDHPDDPVGGRHHGHGHRR